MFVSSIASSTYNKPFSFSGQRLKPASAAWPVSKVEVRVSGGVSKSHKYQQAALRRWVSGNRQNDNGRIQAEVMVTESPKMTALYEKYLVAFDSRNHQDSVLSTHPMVSVSVRTNGVLGAPPPALLPLDPTRMRVVNRRQYKNAMGRLLTLAESHEARRIAQAALDAMNPNKKAEAVPLAKPATKRETRRAFALLRAAAPNP